MFPKSFLALSVCVCIAPTLLAQPDAKPDAEPPPLLITQSPSSPEYPWARDKAIDFGMSQTAKMIDYVYVAAIAMLGLVMKSVVFDRLNTKENERLHEMNIGEKVIILCVIVLTTISIGCGLLSYGYLPLIMAKQTFSLNDSIGHFALFQYIFFGLAAISLGLFGFVRIFFARP